MCDTIAGELLVSFHESDPAGAALVERIHSGGVPHVRVIEDLGYRVTRAGLHMRRGIQLKFYRLEVPPGEEAFKVNYLQFFYKHEFLDALINHRLDPSKDHDVISRSNYHFQVVPHSWLSVRQSGGPPGIGFTFTQTHDDYKKLMGWNPSQQPATRRRVLVLDTGLDPASACPIVEKRNFVDNKNQSDVSDDHGHGTAVTEVIHDLCDSAEFVIYKVADHQGRASEWDTLAALAAKSDADLVNISLAFGLPDRVCAQCGRESQSSRSAVFENLLDQLEAVVDGPLLVAAAGNDSLSELSFPARFENVVALESINNAKQLSRFSNRASNDHEGKPHNNVFVLPGGDEQQNVGPTEYIGTSAAGKKFFGTSFSSAYATGLIAALWSSSTHSAKDRQQLIGHLRNSADSGLPGFSGNTHGNGMIVYK